MSSSLFSKDDLLKTFQPLSESGKAYLEIQLVNPKTGKAEGRGFFNDTDFLMEACRGLVGRFNFCLSNFSYTQAQIPTRASYNQFDRALPESPTQDQARAHSLSLLMLFKPDLIQEMSSQGAQNDQYMNILYGIDAILGRLNIKCYGVDYFLTGVVLRFWAPGALQKRPLNRISLGNATKRLMEALEKKMTPQEMKHFALSASIFGKIFDPAPGLPGVFAGDASDCMVVTSSGSLSPGEDGAFSHLFDEVFEARKPARLAEMEGFSPGPNTQGLSQSWQDAPYEAPSTQGLRHEKGFGEGKSELADVQAGEGMRELVAWFQNYSQGKWRWPLYSAAFNKLHQGAACGDLLLLECDAFAGELGFQFLMQCAEGFSKEGTGRILIFTKKRTLGDLALAALSRHYKGNPFAGKPGAGIPDAGALVKAFGSLFPNPPQIAPCGRNDGLDQLLKYLEHDYLPKQRKRGNSSMPVVILIDNLEEFAADGEAETYRGLSQMKMRLREFNGSLWVTRKARRDGDGQADVLGLADYLLSLDHDGSREGGEAGAAAPESRRPGATAWEASFLVDLSLSASSLINEISLAKIRFQAHGSHRRFHGHYVYHRPSCLFKEVNPVVHPAAEAPSVAPAAHSRQGPGPGR